MPFVPHYKRPYQDPAKSNAGCTLAGVTLFIAVVSATISIWNTWLVGDQVHLMQDQLITMREQQRAWVTATIKPDYIKWTEQGGLRVVGIVEAKNVGQSIATGVDADIRLLLADKYAAQEITAVRDSMCADFATAQYRTAQSFGSWVAPNAAEQISVLSEIDAKVMTKKYHKDEPVDLIVVGCIGYQVPQSPKRYQTGFAYVLDRIQPNDPFYKRYPELDSGKPIQMREDVPDKELRMLKAPWGNGFAN